MIDLIREGAYLVLVWCVGLVMTYGLVESILFMPLRLSLSAEFGFWPRQFVYCPMCSGFWLWGIAGAVGYLDISWFVKMAAIGVSSLLIVRAMGADLVVPREEIEGSTIEKMRAAGRGASDA